MDLVCSPVKQLSFVLVVTSSPKVQFGQVISSTVRHEMPVSVCGCIAYLELNLVIRHEPISSVYMQLVCEKAGFFLMCVDCL